MPLVFAGVSPHPPIIIPNIGTTEDLQKVSETVFAMKKLASAFKEAEVDTLIVVSPHGLIYPDRFNVCAMKKLFGTFAEFSQPDIMFELNNDIDLALKIDAEANKQDVKTLAYDNEAEFYELDHGIMVPLYYLSRNQEFTFKLLPISYSNFDKIKHFSFGQIIRDIAKNYPGRVGILASGDLSHQLFQNPDGKVFDETLKKDLEENNIQKILEYEEEDIEKVGECGYRSILVLLGALDGIDAKPEVISYEGPFGVGYLVANYKLKEY